MTHAGRVTVAYVVLCVVWGSTFPAIRVGLAYVPPSLFAAFRFVLAGAALTALVRMTGRSMPRSAADWTTNVVVGFLLLVGANGLVFWAIQFVPAGVAAIFIATVALWLAVFDAIIPGSSARATPLQFIGLAIGFGGTVLLVGADLETLRQADWRGPVALTVASALWGLGSVYSQRHPTHSGPYANAATQMLAGGVGLLVVGTIAGEWSRVTVTWGGVVAVGYLAAIGSVVGFTAYVYVLQHLPATTAGTYAYANTVVAVLLGWSLLGEEMTSRTVVALLVVIGAVIWVRRAGHGGVGATRPAVSTRRVEPGGAVVGCPPAEAERAR